MKERKRDFSDPVIRERAKRIPISVDEGVNDLKNFILENFPSEPSNMDENPIQTAIRLLKGSQAGGASPKLGIDRTDEWDILAEDLDHSIHHLEVAATKTGPIDKLQFSAEVDGLAKKIAKVALNYVGPNEDYSAAIRLGALFNAVKQITTILCANEIGGMEGEIAKDLVYTALAGE